MAEPEWKKRGKRFDFFFDFSDMDKLFNDLMKDFDRLERRPGKPMVMGFNMKLGQNGQPIIERFGNIQPKEGKPTIANAREPLVDVINGRKDVTITAELPGVEKKDIQVNTPDKKMVEINVKGERPFYKRIVLGEAVKPKTAKAKFNNGILEVTFEREKEGKEGNGVKIE